MEGGSKQGMEAVSKGGTEGPAERLPPEVRICTVLHNTDSTVERCSDTHTQSANRNGKSRSFAFYSVS